MNNPANAFMKTTKDKSSEIIFRVNGGHAACQIAQDFAHRLQLHNRLGINLIVQVRVLNKSVLILYEKKNYI